MHAIYNVCMRHSPQQFSLNPEKDLDCAFVTHAYRPGIAGAILKEGNK